jgi:GntR family transcriptional regulator, transcriptional repressor for pyruvate dehydrogenase complex
LERKEKHSRIVSRAAPLTKVTRTTLTSDIYAQLVARLIKGVWTEGQRIPTERELALQLGVGRTSLREAMKALEIMGMIETRLGDGTYVCHRSEFLSRPLLWAIMGSDSSDASELIEARRSIESELVGLSASRATAEDLKEIGKYLDQMESHLRDPIAFQEADINFHVAIAEAAHNRILQNALQLIRNLMHQWIGKALMDEGVPAAALEQHKQIFFAIAKRNAERARAAMCAHLEAMGEYLLQTDFLTEQRHAAPTRKAIGMPLPPAEG